MNSTKTLTVLGGFAAVFQYLTTSGMTMPTNKAEWASFGLSMMLAGMGYLAQGVQKKND